MSAADKGQGTTALPPVCEYVISRRGWVHLVDQADAAVADLGCESPRTLCGRLVDEWWVRGDETVSGLVADCHTCKRILRGAS